MSAPRITLPPRPHILVIALRRLGDVLLSTPLVRSIKRAWPEARLDVLVFADTAAILDGNPDIDRVITMSPRPTPVNSLALAARLVGRYDLAVSTQSGDRPTAFAILAARLSVAPIEDRFSGRLKRALLTRGVAHDPRAHRVEAMLRLADALGISRVPQVVPPHGEIAADRPVGQYAVIHAAPMFKYKRWTPEGWRALASGLTARGLTVIATGGPSETERKYLDDVWSGSSVVRCDGRLTWAKLCNLLEQARAFIGPDTSVTHLAAAVGCPTVALYGPTDPRLWGPWPIGGLQDNWVADSSIQNRGNVWLIQQRFPCVPCQLEGCERNVGSVSQCLIQLSLPDVISALDQALRHRES